MRRSSPELGDALSRELVPAYMHAHENLNPRADRPWEPRAPAVDHFNRFRSSRRKNRTDR